MQHWIQTSIVNYRSQILPRVRNEHFSLKRIATTVHIRPETEGKELPLCQTIVIFRNNPLFDSFGNYPGAAIGGTKWQLSPLTSIPNKEETIVNEVQLTLEQKFNLRWFQTQVDKMSPDQAKDFLVQLYEQTMVREATYKELLKHQWGIEPQPGLE